ncbi:MAG: 3'-5' exonuclease [Elusimicrobia bacterium]|nr:3'-5' exonuclease [Elusimicrobiota bacterium]
MTPDFVAIDFETADQGADSACAVGLVKVEGGRIVRSESHLIRPPRRTILFTYIHGIEWRHVADKPVFKDVWPRVAEMLSGARFIAAHNAPFDRGVLSACCAAAGVRAPSQPFVCTVRLARKAWNLRPTKLPNVCEHLGIALNHHEALSDATACAKIVLAALAEGKGGLTEA